MAVSKIPRNTSKLSTELSNFFSRLFHIFAFRVGSPIAAPLHPSIRHINCCVHSQSSQKQSSRYVSPITPLLPGQVYDVAETSSECSHFQSRNLAASDLSQPPHLPPQQKLKTSISPPNRRKTTSAPLPLHIRRIVITASQAHDTSIMTATTSTASGAVAGSTMTPQILPGMRLMMLQQITPMTPLAMAVISSMWTKKEIPQM